MKLLGSNCMIHIFKLKFLQKFQLHIIIAKNHRFLSLFLSFPTSKGPYNKHTSNTTYLTRPLDVRLKRTSSSSCQSYFALPTSVPCTTSLVARGYQYIVSCLFILSFLLLLPSMYWREEVRKRP